VTELPEGAQTPYDRFGGEPFFTSLTAAFYARVAVDPVLRPMYPDEDLAHGERRLRMFLMQYWGGPDTYQQERGHPRLRMRHLPFPIDGEARDHWLANMRGAIAEQEMSDDDENELWMYLLRAAFAMQNIDDPAPGQPSTRVDQPITETGPNAGGHA
jgi:hemoglobin